MTEKDDRRTPDDLWRELDGQYRFTLDAAASAENAKLPRFYDRDSNGLERPWRDESVWCNPPYSHIAPWPAKAWREMAAGCQRVVMLVPANKAEQPWWQEEVEPFRDGRAVRNGARLTTHYIKGRTRFVDPSGQRMGSPEFGCVLLVWERAA